MTKPDAVLAVRQTTIAVAEENALPVLRLALQEKIYLVFWKIQDPSYANIDDIQKKRTS